MYYLQKLLLEIVINIIILTNNVPIISRSISKVTLIYNRLGIYT